MKMGENCNYFKKYGTQVMYAGSVYDGIKVSKLDEYDMDIVIRLPINYDDIIIEPEQAGFVKLKIESAFDNLDKQKDWEKCHVVTRDWRDSEKYFLQNKFRFWMHSIVQKALNDLNRHVTVNGTTYVVKLGKQSGPAHTLFIQNAKGNEPFKLDVDLVPVIRFMHPRWIEGYRTVEGNQVQEWLVVPKPNKALEETAQNRCWRLSYQEFEREMMKDCQQLKKTIRLVKKLRDSLKMNDIASYYIKTLFLWKIDETQDKDKTKEENEQTKKKYWQKGLSVLFREMVETLYNAIKEKRIKYFWHEENNLIENLKPTVQALYVKDLKKVLDAIDSNDIDKVASYLLTVNEFNEFTKSEFYQKQMEVYQRQLANQQSTGSLNSQVSRQESVVSANSDSRDSADSQNTDDATVMDLVRKINNKLTAMADDQKRLKKIEEDSKGSITRMNSVVDILKEINSKVDDQNERLNKLESTLTEERDQLQTKLDLLMDKLDLQNERLLKLERANRDYKEKFLNVGDALAEALEIDHKEIRLN
ncbi:mab-21 protein domain-containing protein [Phthorimaea operculella]|nr:mab-21 protein domain-containing protein [Phthorimaea operculella]